MMIPLPRPVGIASCAEAMVVETDGPIDPDEALRRLQQHTPEELNIRSVRALEVGERLQPAAVRYRLELDGPVDADLRLRLERLRESQAATVERVDHETKKKRTVDIRPFLKDLQGVENGVEFTLRVVGTGSGRPSEVAGLLGFDAAAVNHRIRRMDVLWQ